MELRQWDEVNAQEVARQLVDVTCETDLKFVTVRRQGDYAAIDVVFRFPKSLNPDHTLTNFILGLSEITRTAAADNQQPLITTPITWYANYNKRLFSSSSRKLPTSFVILYVDDVNQYVLAEFPIDCSAWPKNVAAMNLYVPAKCILGACPLQPRDVRIPVVETRK